MTPNSWLGKVMGDLGSRGQSVNREIFFFSFELEIQIHLEKGRSLCSSFLFMKRNGGNGNTVFSINPPLSMPIFFSNFSRFLRPEQFQFFPHTSADLPYKRSMPLSWDNPLRTISSLQAWLMSSSMFVLFQRPATL